MEGSGVERGGGQISHSTVIGQAADEAARPWILDQCVGWCACLLPRLRQCQIILPSDICVNNFPKVALDSAEAEIEPTIDLQLQVSITSPMN